MPITNSLLMKVAALGGFITAAMGYMARSKINDRIAEQSYYKDALEIARTHRGVEYLLGTPIKVGKIDVTAEQNNYTRSLNARYEIPIQGPKGNASVLFWADRHSMEDSWKVSRVELQLQNEPNRRLLVLGDLSDTSRT